MEKTIITKDSESLQKTRLLVLTGLLFATALILSVVENSLPSPVPAIPGVKMGLSNIVVMYSLFFLKRSQAFAIAVLKALFVLLTRGWIGGFLSFFGGILSLSVMILLMLLLKDRISYLLISISGAVLHNIGQFLGVCLLYTSLNMWIILPVLCISGLTAGIITATLLKLILPVLDRLGLKQ